MGMTVDVTSYQDAFANFDKGIAILNLIKLLEVSKIKPRNILYFKENIFREVFFLHIELKLSIRGSQQ